MGTTAIDRIHTNLVEVSNDEMLQFSSGILGVVNTFETTCGILPGIAKQDLKAA
jgi:hypothetical protein